MASLVAQSQAPTQAHSFMPTALGVAASTGSSRRSEDILWAWALDWEDWDLVFWSLAALLAGLSQSCSCCCCISRSRFMVDDEVRVVVLSEKVD